MGVEACTPEQISTRRVGSHRICTG